MDRAITVGLVVLILVGFAASYRTLRDLAATAGGYPTWLAPAIPLSFDLGIVVLSLKVARAAREGRTAPVLRLLVAALSAPPSRQTPPPRPPQLPGSCTPCHQRCSSSASRASSSPRAAAHSERRGLLPSPLPRLRLARWILAPPQQLGRLACVRSRPTAGSTVVLTMSPLGGQIEKVSALTANTDSASWEAYMGANEGRGPRNMPDADRQAVLQKILQDDPAMTAPQLTARLRDVGHVVSVRTAQRLRAQVMQQNQPFGVGD